MENVSTIIEQLKPFLSQMSEILGQGAEFSWKIAIKQQYVDGFIGLFWALIGIAGIFIGIKAIKYTINKWEANIPESIVALVVMGTILGFFSLIPFIAGSISAIEHFVNPEWQAIKDIANLIRSQSN